MPTLETSARIKLQNILFLTDFSEPSEAALPFAISIARKHGAKVHALHVAIPDDYIYAKTAAAGMLKEAEEERVRGEMQRVESQLAGVAYETSLEWGAGVWPTVERSIREDAIDLVVLGTHGRTGAQKFMLGSIAEEIFRRSPVPVLTIGPGVRGGAHNGASFHRVLFATDFSPEAEAAAPYAFALAQQNQARLLLLLVLRRPERRSEEENENDCRLVELSVAEALHRMYEMVPQDAMFTTPPEAAVDFGEPAERILATAKQRGADLIVLGVRGAAGRMGAATHLERATAHKVVAHATCPVLTVRG
ncbi:MAG: universal stress protein [Candidatus Acidiferrales bacterium]